MQCCCVHHHWLSSKLKYWAIVCAVPCSFSGGRRLMADASTGNYVSNYIQLVYTTAAFGECHSLSVGPRVSGTDSVLLTV